jgi:6,7-dimethyl-8-ribityllumazine synthase
MATEGNSLSEYNPETVQESSSLRIGIVYAEWNSQITHNLRDGAVDTLLKHGVRQENIVIQAVPGSYELPLGAQLLLENETLQAVITLGSVIKGETPHFDFVCQAVAQGIKDVSLKFSIPVIFGVLTDNNMQQSIDRSGGRLGNKGVEAAVTALRMAWLSKNLKENWGPGKRF